MHHYYSSTPDMFNCYNSQPLVSHFPYYSYEALPNMINTQSPEENRSYLPHMTQQFNDNVSVTKTEAQFATPPNIKDFHFQKTPDSTSSSGNLSTSELNNSGDSDFTSLVKNDCNNGKLGRSKRRSRTQYTKQQIDCLEAIFLKSHYPGVNVVDKLSDKLNLSIERISVWFQNRRAKFKKSKKSGKQNNFESSHANSMSSLEDSDQAKSNRKSLESLGHSINSSLNGSSHSNASPSGTSNSVSIGRFSTDEGQMHYNQNNTPFPPNGLFQMLSDSYQVPINDASPETMTPKYQTSYQDMWYYNQYNHSK